MWAMLILLTVACSLPAEDDEQAWVHYADGKLSVAFEDTAFEQALEQTAQATGIQFSVNPGVTGWIDAFFKELPLQAAIKRLLTGYNYMLLYDKNAADQRQLSRVMVLGRVVERSPPQIAINAPLMSSTATLSASAPAEIVLQRRDFGNYIADGKINAKPVEFLVDTGATTIAISGELAQRLGLSYGSAKSIETANGRTTGFETTLQSVQLGALKLNQVRAIIMPNMAMGRRVLLGMNFLQFFELVQRDGLLIIRQYGNP